MQKRYDDDAIMIVVAFLNTIIIIFVNVFDDVCAESSAYQIIILAFKHVLTLFLIIIDHKYNFNLIISLYIKSSFCF